MTIEQPALFEIEQPKKYKKSIEIHKRNELVRGSMGEVSIYASKLLNAIYYLVQKQELFEEGWQNTSFKELRDLMRLENTNRYVDVIKEALTELAKPIPLSNYTDTKGKKWDFKLMKFLDDAQVNKETEWKVEFKIYPEMLNIMKIQQENGNFTKLDFYRLINNFKSKYTMKFYEYVVSFRSLKMISLNLETLQKIFNSNKSFSELMRIVDRCEKEIKEHDPFMETIQKVKDKKNKVLIYYFDQTQKHGRELSLQQFVFKVKEAYAGQPFVKPYKLGLTKYKKKARLSISKDSKLVINDFSNTVLEADEVKEIFKLLFEREELLGMVKKEYEDYIGETIIIQAKYYEIIDIKKDKVFSIKLKDEEGRIGWSNKTYVDEEEMIAKIEERL